MMVKLFFAGIAICILVVVGVFSAVMTPLMAGVDRNLGGSPKMPFHSPLPQPIAQAIHSVIGQATPSLMLTGALGIVALLLLYTAGALISSGVRREKARRRRWAELRWRMRVSTARERQATASASATAKAEIEALWE